MTTGDREAGRWTARLGPFGKAPFAVYWTGGFVSNIGTWLQTVAASVFVYQLTGSVLMVGVLNFASFLPIVLFSVYGGSLADRMDRRRIVVVTHVVSGLVALGLGLVTLAGLAEPLPVIVVGFALSTSYALAKPSIISLLSAVVPREELSEAVSLNTLQFTVGQLLGPLLAALVMGTVGAAAAFLLNAVTYLGPIASMTYLSRRGIGGHPRRADGRPAPGPVGGVFGYIRDRPWIGAMLLGVVISSAFVEIMRTLSPALAVERLHVDESYAGILIATQSLGSALAVLAFVPLQRRGLAPMVATVALGIQALGLFGAAMATSLPMAAGAGFLVGLGFSLCFPYLTSALQMGVTDDIRGRVMSVHQIAHLGNRPFTALAVGVIAASLGVPAAFLAAAAFAPLGVLCVQRATRLVRADPDAAIAVGSEL
jgi:MFS family permease